jgi:hypothetical protein
VALAEKRQEVMLAEAVEIDVLDDHHLAVINCEQRVVDDFVDVGLVSAGQEAQRLFHALRRVAEAFAQGSSRVPPAGGRSGLASAHCTAWRVGHWPAG